MRRLSFEISTDYTPRTRRLSWLKSPDLTPAHKSREGKRTQRGPVPFGRRQLAQDAIKAR